MVRGCEVDDLIRTALTHLRVSQTDKQRVAFYRAVAETGSAYLHDTAMRGTWWDRAT